MNKYNIERVSNVNNYIIAILCKTPLTINTFISQTLGNEVKPYNYEEFIKVNLYCLDYIHI